MWKYYRYVLAILAISTLPCFSMKTPLIEAIMRGDIQCAQGLISKGIGIDEVDDIGYTPLHWAGWQNSRYLVSLLALEANLYKKDKYGNTPLHIATWCGHENIVPLLIGPNVKLYTRNNTGETPLSNAVAHGYGEIVSLLLKAGVNPNGEEDEDGDSLLSWVVVKGNKDIASLLIAAGANVNKQNNKGDTTLHYATKEEIVQLLLSSGADLDVRNKKGDTPLDVAERRKATNIVQLFNEAKEAQRIFKNKIKRQYLALIILQRKKKFPLLPDLFPTIIKHLAPNVPLDLLAQVPKIS
jgi:ankyrin repeat protein